MSSVSLVLNRRVSENQPLVGVIMGSKSDWDTMSAAAAALTEFGIPHECQVVSAHRTPAWMTEYASTAADRGLQVIIAGAGGAAHLPGMVAAQTVLPVIGVPVQSAALNVLDSLLSIVQMPRECRLRPSPSVHPAPPTQGCSPSPSSRRRAPSSE